MAILDAKLEMSDAQSMASLGAASAVTSTDILDFGTHANAWGTAVTPDIGEGGELEWNVSVDTVLVGASANITCNLVTGTAVASGAMALSENHLFTVEAFEDYYAHLAPNGIPNLERRTERGESHRSKRPKDYRDEDIRFDDRTDPK